MSSSIRPSRGRTAPPPARPANASSAAGSRAKPDESRVKSSTTTTSASRARTQNNAARTTVTKATTVQAPTRTRAEPPSSRVRATTTVKGTLPGAASNTSSSRPPSAASKEHTRPRAQEVASVSEHSEALQGAAQSCAWKYMASTLEVEFENAENIARATLNTRRDELAAEEADIAESRVRFEAERLIQFYDELGDREVADEIATIVLRYKRLEKTVSETTAAALQVSSLPLDEITHVSQYSNVLDQIESLEDECRELEVLVHSLLTTTTSFRSDKLPTVLRDISDIIAGHAENAACARDVVQCSKENYRMGIGTLTLI
ncbi:hypothetical protein BD309DRAFT_898092 [Dichomitus squalens]|nr:hypothetical protein BD309DRAFT_898092 [Dichomitus squalens]